MSITEEKNYLLKSFPNPKMLQSTFHPPNITQTSGNRIKKVFQSNSGAPQGKDNNSRPLTQPRNKTIYT